MRGAAHAENGKPIIALPSTTRDGETSRIVPWLKTGAGVVTSRADVHYVVTEYAWRICTGKPCANARWALIHIAHPNFRDELLRQRARGPAGSPRIKSPCRRDCNLTRRNLKRTMNFRRPESSFPTDQPTDENPAA